MDKEILRKHIEDYTHSIKKDFKSYEEDREERKQLISYYQEFTKERILTMSPDKLYEYLSKLWAMLIWGNKHYIVDKIVEDNGLDNIKENLANLVWGHEDIEKRWDNFRTEIKGMGPAMISEILCKSHPDKYMLWNRRAYVALNYLKVDNLPRYDYQLTGKVYKHLCDINKEIAVELENQGLKDVDLLIVDYFIWAQLQVEDNLSKIYLKKTEKKPDIETPEQDKFVHDDIRDKLRDIGQWLGFAAKIEQKVSEGSKVDTIWESTIGNMGRVIYVFEVQTKGSIDSLILNLLKSLINPAVQGVVAVSDANQIEKIKNYVRDVKDLKDKLKYWDYEEILKVHESLEFVNERINSLGLVPEGF